MTLDIFDVQSFLVPLTGVTYPYGAYGLTSMVAHFHIFTDFRVVNWIWTSDMFVFDLPLDREWPIMVTD